ncbi:hypothetical protein A8E25_02815 [Burkholderia cenocepacia]|nr:hypothetical protein A8D61_30070 [Burkholderia cenocepacia]WJN73024.1 hypothetical protein OH687_22205 [Burkholderia anthina]AQQ45489.1 hypothetical protein A8F32_06180 [Burkholderia cenocepacia]ONI95786.1 hypothetical protein A8F33_26115 [Burkholderia cenocepacia]ONJ00298.1 hypothetical protein A8F53_09285 [Burkholderia cenocepacia]
MRRRRRRFDDIASVARNADFPLTHVKSAPVEADRHRSGRRDAVVASVFPSGPQAWQHEGAASVRRYRP